MQGRAGAERVTNNTERRQMINWISELQGILGMPQRLLQKDAGEGEKARSDEAGGSGPGGSGAGEPEAGNGEAGKGGAGEAEAGEGRAGAGKGGAREEAECRG